MKVIIGALGGIVSGLLIVAIIGFVWGGINKAAPCRSAPDFLTGAFFGSFAFTFIAGPLAAATGLVAGASIGAFFELLANRSESEKSST